MNDFIVKVCGMRQPSNMASLEKLPIDWMGFIFYDKSPRVVSKTNKETIRSFSTCKKVGVFVNETTEYILNTINDYALDLVQLHGDEQPEQCRELSKTTIVIKAISIAEKEDLDHVDQYKDVVDYFLFDTKHKDLRGGSGQQFNWNILSAYKGKTPFLLSGGIGLQDVEQVKRFSHPNCVGIDINSKFEVSPGVKHPQMVEDFIQQIKKNEVRRR